MAKTITPINKATDTFDTWVTQTNTIIDTLATEILTANNNANGAFVTGNSQLFGSFTANVVAVYNELRGGNVQASGALLITSDATVNTGNFTMGVDDSVPALLTLYGGGTGEPSARIHLYNNFDDDTNAVYWDIQGEDGTGDFLIQDDAGTDALRIDDATLAVTIAQGATITTGGLTVTAGGLNVDAGGTVLDGGLAETSGVANIGVNDTTAGLVRIYGGGVAGQGGAVHLYNASDHDTNADYWRLGCDDGTGDFEIGDPGLPAALRIDETTFLTTLANGLVVTAGGLTVTAGVSDFGANVDLGINNRLFLDDDNDTYIYASSDDVIAIGAGGTVRITQTSTATTLSENLIVQGGIANVGVNDSVQGTVSIFGSATAGGILNIYNGADDDATPTTDYWSISSFSTGGDLGIARAGIATALTISRTTGEVTIANGLNITLGGIDVQGGVSTFSANVDLEGTARIILDADNDSDLYASADDTVVIRTGGTARMTINNTTVDYGSTALRTGGDIWIDTDTGDFRAGAGTSNLVANSSLIRLANSTVTLDITKPTAAQVSNGNIFLAADGVWKEPIASKGSVVTSGTTAQIMDSWLKSTYRSGEYFFTVEDNAANSRSVAKVLVLHDNSVTNAYITEYGVVESNVALGSYSANCNTTHCIVYFTPTVTAATVKFSRDLTVVA